MGDNMKEKYMGIALKEAYKAYKNGDVPVGCIIVKNDKVIAKAYNRKEKNKNAIYHAEILAITKACKKNKSWHLDDCEMYVTLEPCLMCIGAISQARIKKIYYATDNKKFGFTNYFEDNKIMNHKIEIEKDLCKSESEKLLKSFFKVKR